MSTEAQVAPASNNEIGKEKSANDEESAVQPLEVEQGEQAKNAQENGQEPPKGAWGKFQYMLVSGSAKKSDDYNVPEISLLQLFLKFLWFGCRAFGGKKVFTLHDLRWTYDTLF